MEIDFEGRKWQFDTDDLDVKQGSVLWKTYSLTIKDWTDGFPELDQRCYHFAYWLMLAQNGVHKPIEGCNPKIIEFMAAYAGAATAKAEAEAAAPAEPEPELPPTTPSQPAQPPGSTESATPTATTPQPPGPLPEPTVS